MRFIHLIGSFFLAALLFACGGGGGSPGLSSSSNSTFTVIAPAAVTLQVGSLQSYAITGGVKPYAVYSSDPAVALGWIGGDDYVYVGTGKAGTATVTVVDSKNSKFDIAVTAGSSTLLQSTAPSLLTIAPGVANAKTFIVSGGVAPYSVESSFPAVVTTSLSGNQFTVTGLQVSASAVNVIVRDASGGNVIVAVTVGTVPLAVNPTAITAYIGDKVRAIVTGGTRPYRVQSGIDEAALSVQIVGDNIVEAVGGQVATAAPVTIIDANNQSVQLSLTLSAGQDVLRVQPNSLTIPQNIATPDITLMVYGASSSGGIQVFTSNTSVLRPKTPVANADGTGYAVTLTGGNTCSSVDANGNGNTSDPGDTPGSNKTITITVMDAKGKVGTSTITTSYAAGQGGCI